MSDQNVKQREFFVSTVATQVQEALSQSTGAKWEYAPATQAAGSQGAALYKLLFSGEVKGECYLQFEATETKALSNMIATKAPDATDAFLGVLENAVTEIMLTLMAEYGEVEVSVQPAEQLASGASDVSTVTLSGGGAQLGMKICAEPGLLDTLAAKQETAPAAAPAPAPPAPAPAQAAGEPVPVLEGFDESKLKLILDVELNLTLRFGQRTMTLREILDLNSGSVIELDRNVDEPVELMLDGKVIARGEAVIVDGNYGLRVTDVPESLAAHLAR